MPSFSTYEIAFKSGYHLGARGLNLEESRVGLPADTLFAALIHAWRHTGGSARAWCEAFEADPPLLLSSAFPFAGGVRFFPMPLDLARVFRPPTLQARSKALKRIRFLSEGLLRLLLSGQRLDDVLFPADEYQEPTAGVALQEGALWLLSEECAALPAALQLPRGQWFALRRRRLWAAQRTPRVTIDRISSEGNLFHVGRVSFTPGCGLWFGTAWRDSEGQLDGGSAAQALSRALHYLQDEGLGGERTAGYGAFTLRSGEDVRLPAARPGKPAMLLSRYHPRADELEKGVLDGSAAYQLARICGYLRSPDAAAQPRRQVTMVVEGSIIEAPDGLAGDLVDASPTSGGSFPHPVYRYGYALAVDFPAPVEVPNA